MRPVERIKRLYDLLSPADLTVIVDIGANPFAGTPPYGVLRRSDKCLVIGFEPQPEALQALQELARHNDRFLPYAIGDGGSKKLYMTRNSGLVSVLKPQQKIADLLGPWWRRATEIKSIVEIETHALDDLDDIPHLDFLKIDIQGGELDVFRNARRKLRDCVAIQTEVCLHPYYDGQPTFGAIQNELAQQGFIAHKFVEMSAHPVSHRISVPDNVKIPPSQSTVADMIFIRNPTDMGRIASERLKHLALLAFAVFRSYDLVLRCISELQDRGDVLDQTGEEAVHIMGG